MDGLDGLMQAEGTFTSKQGTGDELNSQCNDTSQNILYCTHGVERLVKH